VAEAEAIEPGAEPDVEIGADRTSDPTAVDPVCGMRVDPAHRPGHRDTDTGRHVFCSAQCGTFPQVAPDVGGRRRMLTA
jgi:P-type Cu+ transporter